MCYAIPGKIVRLDGNIAIVDYFGEHRRVLNEFEDITVGDYVYAQGGIVIQKISKKEALLILKGWKHKFFELKKLDNKISTKKSRGNINKNFIEIIEKAKDNKKLEKKELLRLLKTNNKEELDLLYRTANQLRQKHLKNACCIHGIIEFSNYCRNDCFYCGIRKRNKKLKRYRMTIREIVERAKLAVNKFGFKAIVLQSGEDSWYTTEKLVKIIKKIKEECGVLIFISIGQRSFDCYKKMYEAGARGVLFRFENSNKKLYKRFHYGKKANFQNRIKLLRYIDRLRYIIATGSLIGIPNQTENDILEDILLTKSLNAEMYSFGPLIPHPETPLADTNLININTMLKVIAVSRLVDPHAKILVTTALETLDKKNARKKALLAGANSLMINVTPTKYRKLYYLYPNRPDKDKEISKNIEETVNMLYSLGRAPTDFGLDG
jgi:biotin synthase